MTERTDAASPANRTDGRVPRRRQFLKGAGAGVAASALAGCTWLQDDGSGGPDGGGGGGSGPGVDTLRVGVLALTPGSNPLGEAMVNGAKLAARQLSESDDLDADVEVVVGDTEASPSTAKQEYERLVRKERADVTVGVFLNRALQAVLPRIASAETLHFTTAAVGLNPVEQIEKNYEKYKYHFRPGPLNIAQIARAQVEFLERQVDPRGWESAAVVVEDLDEFDPFYDRLMDAAPDHLDVVEDGRTPVDLRDWRTVFDKVESAGADLMLTGQSLSGVAAAKIWHTQKRSFEFGGLHVPSQFPGFWDEVGGSCEYIFSMTAATPDAEITPRTQEFMGAYTDSFDGYPAYTGATTYDAVRMYADAVRKTGSTAPESLISYLEQRTYTDGVVIPDHEFQGPDAEYPHDPVWTSTADSGVPLWHQWQEQDGEGTQAVFAPQQHKQADYRKPPWLA